MKNRSLRRILYQKKSYPLPITVTLMPIELISLKRGANEDPSAKMLLHMTKHVQSFNFQQSPIGCPAETLKGKLLLIISSTV